MTSNTARGCYFSFFFYLIADIFNGLTDSKQNVLEPSGKVGLWVFALGKLGIIIMQCVSSIGYLLRGLIKLISYLKF